MFVGTVDFKNETALDIVVVSLKGTALRGQWDTNTDLLLLCVKQKGRFCTCRPSDHPSRYAEYLDLPKEDAELLAEWMKNTFQEP